MNTVIHNTPAEIKLNQTIIQPTHYGTKNHTVVFVDGDRVATKTTRHKGEKIITLWEHKTYCVTEKVADWSVFCEKESERPFVLSNVEKSELEQCYWSVVSESMDDQEAFKFASQKYRESSGAWSSLISNWKNL